MRRVNQNELEAAFSLPKAPARDPDPLFGQPEAKAALSLLAAGRSPLFLGLPPGFDLEGQVGGFLRRLLAERDEDPGLALVPEGSGLRAVWGGGSGHPLRPPGPPSVLVLPAPSEPQLFGRFLPRMTTSGAALTFEDYEPGALVRAGSGVLLVSADALAQTPELARKLFAAVREGSYLPTPPPQLPAPAFPEIPVRARLVVAGSEEAIRNLPLPPEPWIVPLRETLPLRPRTLAWLWGYLEGRAGPLSKRELRRIARRLRRQAGHRERIAPALSPLLGLLQARDQGLALNDALDRLRVTEGAGQTRFLDELAEGLWALELAGSRVGEAVGLLVVEEEGGSYGRPARITASAAPGRDGVVSIEREVQLAGPLFGKAVLTLAGYLRRRYAEVGPLSATIQIVFEQTEETIDGDSAGLAELLAVLSILSGLALRQDLAITGAVDQTGRVLPVGGVSEKAEGLLAAADTLGVAQVGLLLPEANLKNLVPEGSLSKALGSGRLLVYLVRTVDEAIELAFGRAAERVHRAVADRLRAFRKLEDGDR